METKGKICLITGATSGIGKITAIYLARLNARIVLIARNKEKAEQTCRDIIKYTGNIAVDVIIADLSSMEQIKQAAQEFNEKYDRLDILINNAGFISTRKRSITIDGLEATFEVNYLSTFLLTYLLLAKLEISPEARIINVASAAHAAAKPDFEDLQMENSYSSIRAYGNSKLYLILFTRQLAKRLKDYRNITVNALHPGFVSSNFSQSAGGITHFFFRLFSFLAISPQKGAETSIYLATAPEALNYSGQYFIKKKPFPIKNNYLTEENEVLLWKKSEELANIKFL